MKEKRGDLLFNMPMRKSSNLSNHRARVRKLQKREAHARSALIEYELSSHWRTFALFFRNKRIASFVLNQ
ncbi:Hypothetical predicted protein [Octopus vulgaris]|uniref:Uncharacterized protein n=1 Tax=Octopus vulgaris TaxID=6645 RepID=A0AA36B362_OCTVU|nr:Hypothetical predicted protein [Octopus vulgaris]